MASEKQYVGPTAIELIAEVTPKNSLGCGVYLVEYVSVVSRQAKETGNKYLKHTLAIKNDSIHEGTLFDLLTSDRLVKGTVPKYNTRLYTLVTCLLKRDIVSGEKINDSELVGKRCKVYLEDNQGFCDVKEIFREDANEQLVLEGIGVYGLPK